MKLIYNKSASLSSKGMTFIQGKEYVVSEKVGEYLLKHFGDAFKVIDEPKAGSKEPTEEPKEEPKETKSKPRRRAKATEA